MADEIGAGLFVLARVLIDPVRRDLLGTGRPHVDSTWHQHDQDAAAKDDRLIGVFGSAKGKMTLL